MAQGGKGFKALSSGMYPLVKSPGTSNNHLDGKTPPPQQQTDYCTIIDITNDEDNLLIKVMINKNRALQLDSQYFSEKIVYPSMKVHNRKS